MGTPNYNLPQYLPTDYADLGALNAGLQTIDTTIKATLDGVNSVLSALSSVGSATPGTYFAAKTNTEYYQSAMGTFGTLATSYVDIPNLTIAITDTGVFRIRVIMPYWNEGSAGGYSSSWRLNYSGTSDSTNLSGLYQDFANIPGSIATPNIPTIRDTSPSVGTSYTNYNLRGGLKDPSSTVDYAGNSNSGVNQLSRVVVLDSIVRITSAGILKAQVRCQDDTTGPSYVKIGASGSYSSILAQKLTA